MKKYDVIVIDDENTVFEAQAWTYGEMASGEKTWEFDGMPDGAIYIAQRLRNPSTGKMQYVLFRQ